MLEFVPFQIVVCRSLIPDPLQTLEPVTTSSGPSLKNETMLPAVLDPWATHALFEAAHDAEKVWLVSLGPKAGGRGPASRGGKADPRVFAGFAGFAGQQQVAGGSERGRADGAPVHDAPESDRADGIDIAAS
jgi:hypothetical protein